MSLRYIFSTFRDEIKDTSFKPAVRNLWLDLEGWWQLRRHFLFDGEYVCLIEIVKRGCAVALIRSPQCRWLWPLDIWARVIKIVERDADYLTVRMVTPSRADVLEEGFNQWLEVKSNPEKFSQQLAKWASRKGSQ